MDGVWCCWACGGDKELVTKRGDMTKAMAQKLVRRMKDLEQGQPMPWAAILELADSRQFWWSAADDKGMCTCPAFDRNHACFHQLALGLQMGRLEIPSSASDIPLSTCQRGAPRRAGKRGAGPDSRDARILHLEAQLKAARATLASSQQPQPKRRRKR